MVPFRLIKFRSMTCEKNMAQDQFNPGNICRVTRFGGLLRKTKIDELPELNNVVKGDMSIVGPRPEVIKYVSVNPKDFEAILRVRPGLSDYASIKYRNEENLLACQPDPEYYYVTEILPDKLRMAKLYAENVSLTRDLCIIGETVKSLLFDEGCLT
jgi:lipopolysaccharide/colanic/teichoic acid biosynthesis glycosyltransferase